MQIGLVYKSLVAISLFAIFGLCTNIPVGLIVPFLKEFKHIAHAIVFTCSHFNELPLAKMLSDENVFTNIVNIKNITLNELGRTVQYHGFKKAIIVDLSCNMSNKIMRQVCRYIPKCQIIR